MNMKDMEAAITQLREITDTLTKRIGELEQGSGPKSRGPKTERSMTEADAFRVKFGDLKPPMSHKEAAQITGLSYGQIFSCRGGYTFKHVKASWKPPVETPPEAE